MNSRGGIRAERLPFFCDPEVAAGILAAAGAPWFWLDGAGAPEGEARVSYLGVAREVRTAERGEEREFLAELGGDRAGIGAPDTAGFYGGWVVALAYEFGVSLMGFDPAPDTEPSALAMRVDAVLALDHDTETAEVRGSPSGIAALKQEYEAALAAVAKLDASQVSDDVGQRHPGQPQWRSSDAEYRDEVEACRVSIHDGDAYVLCLTDTAEARGEWNPLAIYLNSRRAGAAARGGIFVTNTRAFVSSSPERFLSVHGRSISTHPIKGTRRRGVTPTEDAELAAELQRDPKERAENLMIVDLMRNDLSRICNPGTVRVDGFLRVETHPHVHQLVSTVTGELRTGATLTEVLTACFPGGSMTGAPKRSAVEILGGLEGSPRGLYSGCFGWIDDSGNSELAMSIRCIEFRSDRSRFDLAFVGAGGGITADSDPISEAAEKRLKAASALAALLI